MTAVAGPYPHRVKGSVTVHIAVPPGLVWDLVSDVTRIGEFSPETFESDGWTAPPDRGPGRASAVMSGGTGRAGVLDNVHRDRRRPGPRVRLRGGGPGGATANTWRYRLEPAADGTT